MRCRQITRSSGQCGIKRARHRVRQYVKWGYHRDLTKVTDGYYRWRNTIWFLLHLRKLKHGRLLGDLVFLYRTTEHGSSDAIRRLYGSLIVAAYEEGCKAHWRTFRPPFPHEKDDPNRTHLETFIGQRGLQVEFDGGLDPSTLSISEADTAARYAVEELANFPQWLPDLAGAHHGPVQSVLRNCVEADWLLTGPNARGSGVADRLYHGAPSLSRLMARELLGMLRISDPGSPRLLLNVVGVILRGSPGSASNVAQLAAVRVRAHLLHGLLVAPWLLVWLWLDALAALDWLEEKSSSTPRDDIDALFLAVGSWMNEDTGRPMAIDETPSYHDLGPLRRLLRLFYRHVRPEDDVHRVGTYSPDSRDHTQEFRDALLNRLTNTPGPEAHAALVGLADDPLFVRHREQVLSRHFPDNPQFQPTFPR